ncbi:hypothetical protein EST38_g7594 [Candolleomyces aberdarensis]|uniref:Uncharacterized protein n=1 Tax=Candolleomyces aberdarensis TaxID=2316362 RepID=A0A4Q2DGP7_9AGAR|nr:hypothetical protein EST38_g7594 [Candolleomyces aberdarensis]
MGDSSKYTTWSQNIPPVKLRTEAALQHAPSIRRPAHFEDPPQAQASSSNAATLVTGRVIAGDPAVANVLSAKERTVGSAQIPGASTHPLYEQYKRTAYNAKINLHEIQARDYRLGLLLLAIQELADERSCHVKLQEQLLADAGVILQQMELLGLSSNEERLQAVHKAIDDHVGQRQSAGPQLAGASFAVPLGATYQEKYTSDGRVVVDIPLANKARENMSVEEIQRLGRMFVEAPVVSLHNYLKQFTAHRR